jgi:hypothetical protein
MSTQTCTTSSQQHRWRAVRQRARAAERVAFETLENRTMFSDNSVIEAIRHPGPIGPPSPAQYHTHVSSSPKPKFSLYDTSWDAPVASGFTSAWWTAPGAFAANWGEYDANRQLVERAANFALRGGRSAMGQQVPAHALTFLDFEPIMNRSPAYIAKRVKWFKMAAPGVKISQWGIDVGQSHLNRDDVVRGTPEAVRAFAADCRRWAPLVEAIDVLPVCVYMLGPGSVERDLAYMSAVSKLLRQNFPGKPLLAWAWGAYHTSWNPEHSILPETVTRRYVTSMQKNFDGIIVWGEAQDNVLLKQTIREMTAPSSGDSGGSGGPGRSRPGGGGDNGEDTDAGPTSIKDDAIHVLVQGG